MQTPIEVKAVPAEPRTTVPEPVARALPPLVLMKYPPNPVALELSP